MQELPKMSLTPSRLSLTNVGNISAGPHHSYAITPQGLYGWGYNQHLNLGVQTQTDNVYEPLLLSVKVNNVVTSARHTFAWSDETVYGWGSNTKYELGLSQQKYYPITKLTLFQEAAENYIHFVEFACGESHSLAIMKKPEDPSKPEPSTRVLFGWGNSKDSQLPFDSNKIIPYPVIYEFDKEVDHVFATSQYSLMLSEGIVYSWGTDVFGRLGIQRSPKVQRIPRAVSLSKVITIGIGKHHVVAVLQEGSAFSWGAGLHGQLGIGSLLNSHVPALMRHTNQFVLSASCGQHHSLLLTNKDQILSCGSNSHGCLGHQTHLDDRKRSLLPQKINLSGVSKICSGYRHNLALTLSGKIYSWGDNANGQLGLRLMSEMPSEEESCVSVVSPKNKSGLLKDWYNRYREFKLNQDQKQKQLLKEFQKIVNIEQQ